MLFSHFHLKYKQYFCLAAHLIDDSQYEDASHIPKRKREVIINDSQEASNEICELTAKMDSRKIE